MKSLIESLKNPVNAPGTIDPDAAGAMPRQSRPKKFGPTTIESPPVPGHRGVAITIHGSEEEDGVWSIFINGGVIVNSEKQVTAIRAQIDSTLAALGKAKLK